MNGFDPYTFRQQVSNQGEIVGDKVRVQVYDAEHKLLGECHKSTEEAWETFRKEMESKGVSVPADMLVFDAPGS